MRQFEIYLITESAHECDVDGRQEGRACVEDLRMEATESPSLALEYYDKLLRSDSSNAVGLA